MKLILHLKRSNKMKESLKNLGLSLLGVSILPLAKALASLLVSLVKKSPRKEDDLFLKELAKKINEQL